MGRSAGFLGGEEKKLKTFLSFFDHGTPPGRAYERAFPVTCEPLKKNLKGYASAVAHRATRLLKRHGRNPAAPPNVPAKNSESAVVEAEIVDGDGGPADIFESHDSIETFLSNKDNLLSSEDSQIRHLNEMLSIGREKWKMALLEGDDKKAINWQGATVNILQVLDPLKFRRGQEQHDTTQDNLLSDMAAAARRALATQPLRVGGDEEKKTAPPPKTKRITGGGKKGGASASAA